MAIIRSKIARQLLAEGGAPRKGFARGSMGFEGSPEMGGSRSDSPSPSSFDDGFGGGDEFERDTYAEQLSDLQRTENTFPNISDVSGDDLRNISIRPDGTSGAGSIFDYTPISLLKRADAKFIGPFRDKSNLARRTEFLRRQGLIGPGEEELPVQFQDSFLKSEAGLDMLRGMGYTTIQDMINKGEGGDSEPIKRLRAPITEKIDEEPKLSDIQNLLRLRGSAFEDGGQVREGYFGGSIVKGIKKGLGAVKKIAKSPIGKAALFAGLGAYGLGAGPFKGAGFGSGFLKSDAFKKLLLKKGKDEFTFGNLSPFSLIGIPTLLSGLLTKKEEEEDETLPEVARSDPRFQSLINYYGGPTRFAADGGDIDEAPMKMASYGYNDAMSDTYQMFLQMKEKDLIPPEMKFDEFLQEVVPEMSKKQGIERAEAAKGGMMNPNDEMLDLGGNEMDLRGGGFVPLGEYEKKDDVPARLSKNEFVFTADAVRAAGGGSVDRGADLMYKTMKQLENKVV